MELYKKEWEAKRHERIRNTMKILKEFAEENLSEEGAAEVKEILGDFEEDENPDNK